MTVISDIILWSHTILKSDILNNSRYSPADLPSLLCIPCVSQYYDPISYPSTEHHRGGSTFKLFQYFIILIQNIQTALQSVIWKTKHTYLLQCIQVWAPFSPYILPYILTRDAKFLLLYGSFSTLKIGSYLNVGQEINTVGEKKGKVINDITNDQVE